MKNEDKAEDQQSENNEIIKPIEVAESSEQAKKFTDPKMQSKLQELKDEIHKVLVGQDALIDLILIGLFSEGHILLEGVPGIAKTLVAKLLAKSIDVSFGRVQFTPDLMPSDVTGTNIYNSQNNQFEFIQGPIFNHIILIDEVNRAPAKTQAALFECMEEHQVSIDGKTYKLDEPFIVIATQNPIESEGTYRLPEAQLDRFLFKARVDYPSLEEEIAILNAAHENRHFNSVEKINKILTKAELMSFKNAIEEVRVDANLMEYIAQIIQQSRMDGQLSVGGSPRSSLGLLYASKALAFINGRLFVIPDDIKDVAKPVLRHRLNLTAEKEIEGVNIDEVIESILEQVEVPR